MTSVTLYKIDEYSWKACHACSISKLKVWDAVKEIFSNIHTWILNGCRHIGNRYILLIYKQPGGAVSAFPTISNSDSTVNSSSLTPSDRSIFSYGWNGVKKSYEWVKKHPLISAAIIAGLATAIFSYQYTLRAPTDSSQDFSKFFSQQEKVLPSDVTKYCSSQKSFERLRKDYQFSYDVGRKVYNWCSGGKGSAEGLAAWFKPLEPAQGQFDKASCMNLLTSYKKLTVDVDRLKLQCYW